MRRVLVPALALALLGVACQKQANSPAPGAAGLEVGDPAPDFTLESPGAEISLDDYRGERPVLLYFSMGPG